MDSLRFKSILYASQMDYLRIKTVIDLRLRKLLGLIVSIFSLTNDYSYKPIEKLINGIDW